MSGDLSVVSNQPILAAEAQEPDAAEKYQTSSLNLVESYFSLFCRTTEVLLMPRLVLDCGLVGSILLLLLVAALSYFSSLALCLCANKVRVDSFIELNYHIFGKAKHLFSFFFMTYVLGNIICDQSFFISNLQLLLNHGNEADPTNYGYVLVLGINLFSLLFLFSRNLESIKMFSNFAFVSFVISIGMILFTFVAPWQLDFYKKPLDYSKLSYFRPAGVLGTMGIYFLSFTIHDVVIDINAEIKPSLPGKTRKLLLAIIASSFATYAVVSVFGYLLMYQEEDFSNMTNYLLFYVVQLKKHYFWLIFVNYLLTLTFLFDNVLCLVPVIKFIDEYVLEIHSKADRSAAKNRTSVLIKSLFLLAITLIMLIVVHFGIKLEAIYDIVSSICVPTIFLIFPFVCYRICFPESLGRKTFAAGLAVAVLFWAVSLYGCVAYFF